MAGVSESHNAYAVHAKLLAFVFPFAHPLKFKLVESLRYEAVAKCRVWRTTYTAIVGGTKKYKRLQITRQVTSSNLKWQWLSTYSGTIGFQINTRWSMLPVVETANAFNMTRAPLHFENPYQNTIMQHLDANGWESVCWGVTGFLVSWFLSFLISWFLGFLVSKFLSF